MVNKSCRRGEKQPVEVEAGAGSMFSEHRMTFVWRALRVQQTPSPAGVVRISSGGGKEQSPMRRPAEDAAGL